MTMSLSMPDGSSLQLDEAPGFLSLEPALDGARVTVRLTAWTANPPAGQTAAMMTADLLIGGPGGTAHRPRLASLSADALVYNHGTPTQITLSGHISAAALREAEEVRAGGDLWLDLRLKAVTLAGEPPRLSEAGGASLAVQVHAGTWAAELEKVSSASYAEILIPVTSDPELSVAAERLRTARALIRRGEFGAVAAELRQALDPVRAIYQTPDVHGPALSKAARQRTEAERFAIVVQALYSWLSAYIHDDDESVRGCEMDRPAAIWALAAVAGLLHRAARRNAAETA
jgi:hypothetical protein